VPTLLTTLPCGATGRGLRGGEQAVLPAPHQQGGVAFPQHAITPCCSLPHHQTSTSVPRACTTAASSAPTPLGHTPAAAARASTPLIPLPATAWVSTCRQRGQQPTGAHPPTAARSAMPPGMLLPGVPSCAHLPGPHQLRTWGAGRADDGSLGAGGVRRHLLLIQQLWGQAVAGPQLRGHRHWR